MSLILIGLITFSPLELRVTLVDTLFYPREEIFLDVVFVNNGNDTTRILSIGSLRAKPDGLRFHIKNEKGIKLIWNGIPMSYGIPNKIEYFTAIAAKDSFIIHDTPLNGSSAYAYVSPGREKKWMYLIDPGIYEGYAVYHWTAKTCRAMAKPEEKERIIRSLPVFHDSIQSNTIRFRVLPAKGIDSVALEEYTKAIYHDVWFKEDSAIIVCQGILLKYPNSPYAPLAQKMICELSRSQRKIEYEKFIRLFPNHHFVPIMLERMKGLYSKERWIEYLSMIIENYPKTKVSEAAKRLLKEKG